MVDTLVSILMPSPASARLVIDILTAMVIAAFNIRAARKIANVVRDSQPAFQPELEICGRPIDDEQLVESH
jgi:hypothetical protein